MKLHETFFKGLTQFSAKSKNCKIFIRKILQIP